MKILDLFSKVASLSVEKARSMLAEKGEEGVALIDVRQPEEYDRGHIPGARLIPLPGLLNEMGSLDPSKPTIAYCKRGGRSSSAAALMKEQGFTEVYSMDGGFDAWKGLVASGQYEAGMFLLEGRESTEDLMSLAWALEEGSRQFYEQTRNLLSDEETGKVLTELIKAEEAHKTRLAKEYERMKGAALSDERLKKESSAGYMEGGISVKEAVAWMKDGERTLQDILELTMQVESNALDLYIKMKRSFDDEDAKALMASLIEEEKGHLARLGALLGKKVSEEA